jgi:hypothetical protein
MDGPVILSLLIMDFGSQFITEYLGYLCTSGVKQFYLHLEAVLLVGSILRKYTEDTKWAAVGNETLTLIAHNKKTVQKKNVA